MTLTGYLQSFKCRLKLKNRPLRRVEGSKSLPSFSFTLRINSQIYSFNYLAWMSSGFLWSCFSHRTEFSEQLHISLCRSSCISILLLDNMVVNLLNARISWILELLLKVQVFLYFLLKRFPATEVCRQGNQMRCVLTSLS